MPGMKQKKLLLDAIPVIFLLLLSFCASVSAQSTCTPEKVEGGWRYNCDFKNPTASDDLTSLIISITNKIKPFAITVVSFMIIIAGFKYVLAASQGKAGSLEQAKKIFMPALIGVAIIAAGGALLEAIKIFIGVI